MLRLVLWAWLAGWPAVQTQLALLPGRRAKQNLLRLLQAARRATHSLLLLRAGWRAAGMAAQQGGLPLPLVAWPGPAGHCPPAWQALQPPHLGCCLWTLPPLAALPPPAVRQRACLERRGHGLAPLPAVPLPGWPRVQARPALALHSLPLPLLLLLLPAPRLLQQLRHACHPPL